MNNRKILKASLTIFSLLLIIGMFYFCLEFVYGIQSKRIAPRLPLPDIESKDVIKLENVDSIKTIKEGYVYAKNNAMAIDPSLKLEDVNIFIESISSSDDIAGVISYYFYTRKYSTDYMYMIDIDMKSGSIVDIWGENTGEAKSSHVKDIDLITTLDLPEVLQAIEEKYGILVLKKVVRAHPGEQNWLITFNSLGYTYDKVFNIADKVCEGL